MKNSPNDNEELSFITLAAVTANVVKYLITKTLPTQDLVAPAETVRLRNDNDVSDGGHNGALVLANHTGPNLKRQEHHLEDVEHELLPIDQSCCDEPCDEKGKTAGRDTTPHETGCGKFSDVSHAVKKGPRAEAPGSLPEAPGGSARRNS
ncbi:hypothetical protein [Bradyrhizobium sp. LVM 105]|uniref:hypothetical protein n=1 Tax=Bradyrhizobium sp. LVM 105 TaxID=2341115 RepID=UPI000F7FB5B9|nr:hypothetical protein [Bradyrhizobium sp. LVM 105]